MCRAKGIKFFCGDVWGYYGYFFMDLGEHDYVMLVLNFKMYKTILSMMTRVYHYYTHCDQVRSILLGSCGGKDYKEIKISKN